MWHAISPDRTLHLYRNQPPLLALTSHRACHRKPILVVTPSFPFRARVHVVLVEMQYFVLFYFRSNRLMRDLIPNVSWRLVSDLAVNVGSGHAPTQLVIVPTSSRALFRSGNATGRKHAPSVHQNPDFLALRQTLKLLSQTLGGRRPYCSSKRIP